TTATAVAQEPLEVNESLTFGSVGWESDATLNRGHRAAAIKVQLPADAEQGNPTWYGVKPSYIWDIGLAPEEIGYLYVKWNGHAVYQLKVSRRSPFGSDVVHWSLVDAVWGYSAGIQYTSRLQLASTNLATIPSIQPGTNTISVELDLSLAPEATGTVTVLRESEVVAWPLGPASIDLTGDTEVDGDGTVHLDLEASNDGIPTDRLAVSLLVFYGDGEREAIPVESDLIVEHGKPTPIVAEVELSRSDVKSVQAYLDWQTGRKNYTLWPHEEKSPLDYVEQLVSPLGAVVALVVLWISVPASIRSFRGKN
ncbi:MAG: hypothetical protein KC482_01250, partial [Dehalococcoidia bacterium]|nr:hypothetical protein [Dehalococcoidia bacterium]